MYLIYNINLYMVYQAENTFFDLLLKEQLLVTYIRIIDLIFFRFIW